MKKLAVIAFGGNALLRSGQKGTKSEQMANVHETCQTLLNLIEQDYDIVVTHGNGPQVGNILLQNAAGAQVHGIPEMPMDICGSFSQGFIGYMIEQNLMNIFREKNINKKAVTLVTQVLVDKKDEAFKNPVKPIGPYYSAEQVAEFKKEDAEAVYVEDAKRGGWRKVVASPNPIDILNKDTVLELARDGKVVVAVGGGGIPVYLDGAKLKGIDAVIDKDLATSLLAAEIGADEFYILTDVPRVCLNYGTPQQIDLDTLTVADAKKYLAEKQFTEGSMAPKIRAALLFVEKTGNSTIITDAEHIGKNGGTRLIK